jgi:hypothetical protein
VSIKESVYFKAFKYKELISNKVHACLYGSENTRPPVQALILSSTGNSHGLCYPFHYYRKELIQRNNFHFSEAISNDLNEKMRAAELFRGDVLFVSIPIRKQNAIYPKKEVLDFIKKIREVSRSKVIFFDVSDNAISPYFDILPYIDLYLMPFIFKDTQDYFLPYVGGNKYADYLSKLWKIAPIKENEYHSDLFHSVPDREHIHKIGVSWNWVLWKRMIQLFSSQHFVCTQGGKRPIDVNCRCTSYSGWCRIQRLKIIEMLKKLQPPFNIIASNEKVEIKQYYEELENSKIGFSPFGWGEICPKDFEAIMKGCLLMKPSVEHLKTFPQIHIPYKTYVPVAWDLSDLSDKVQEYIVNEEKRVRIVHDASTAYEAFFEQKGFLYRIDEILEKVGLNG